ncbi:tesmin isoform X1 [Symphalangus syndactylus]|uniref:tesmin isoform X1 n=1 Tax=Symphalangus syndactylus TaxID=9590 RepID=UPI0030066F85
MEEGPLPGELPSPEDAMVTELFSPEGPFVSENIGLKAPVKHEEDEFHVFKDKYPGPADTKEPLLNAFNPALGADCKGQVKAKLAGGDSDGGELLGEYPGIPELSALEDVALLPDPQPPASNVHFLSSLLPPHRSPAVLPLGAWVLEGAAHPGVQVIPVESKEAGGTITSNNPEEATFQNLLAQESCCKFPSSQELEDASCCSLKKDSNPMVICQLKGGTQMLCIDNSGTRELKALHLVPQYQDQNNYLQSDVPKPMTALVGRFLPASTKLNLITQQLEGALPSVVNGSAFPSGSTLPGPPKIALARYCDCFASGDFCNNCNCNNCCNNLHHEIERFKAIKACLGRNPEAFQPKIGKGQLGDVKPRHNKGCSCRRSGCLKNYCECYEAQIMCSSICKCIDCKNYEESPERKTLMNMPNYMQTGGLEGSHHLPPGLPKFSQDSTTCLSEPLSQLQVALKGEGRPDSRTPRLDRRPSSCISWEVVEATCACLLAQGEEAEKEHCSECLAEQMILEEFGRELLSAGLFLRLAHCLPASTMPGTLRQHHAGVCSAPG